MRLVHLVRRESKRQNRWWLLDSQRQWSGRLFSTYRCLTRLNKDSPITLLWSTKTDLWNLNIVVCHKCCSKTTYHKHQLLQKQPIWKGQILESLINLKMLATQLLLVPLIRPCGQARSRPKTPQLLRINFIALTLQPITIALWKISNQRLSIEYTLSDRTLKNETGPQVSIMKKQIFKMVTEISIHIMYNRNDKKAN